MDEPTILENVTLLDLLKPWEHGLHIFPADRAFFAACDCGWVGREHDRRWSCAMDYRVHVQGE